MGVFQTLVAGPIPASRTGMYKLYVLLLVVGALMLVASSASLLMQTEMHLSEDLTIVVPLEVGTSSPSLSEEAPVSVKEADTLSKTSTAKLPSPEKTEAPDSSDETKVSRTKNPYSSEPLQIEHLNALARAALVNILCESGGGPVRATSGSGVIIDPRGIVLTNAHVAQYFLLNDIPDIPVSCVIRAGAPARAQWKATVLHLPPAWVKEHANDILEEHAMGTGEHDYALLLITERLDGLPLGSLPYVPADTREAIAFTGDEVLVAAYPAEFIRGAGARDDLNPTTVIAQVGQMLTFSEHLVDALSLGGTVVAQSGSSGGGAINAWGHLIGLLVTTSEGETTATRDLRATTLAHIDRSLAQNAGKSLQTLLQSDPTASAADFMTNQAPALTELLVNAIRR